MSIRVECCPHAADCEGPIRLVLVGADGDPLAQLSFTPNRAHDTAFSLARLLSAFVSRTDTDRLAEGLRTAAVKVWATRN